MLVFGAQQPSFECSFPGGGVSRWGADGIAFDLNIWDTVCGSVGERLGVGGFLQGAIQQDEFGGRRR